MTITFYETKVVVIKFETMTHDNNSLDEVPSHEYLEINIHYKLNWNYRIEKMINGGSKT